MSVYYHISNNFLLNVFSINLYHIYIKCVCVCVCVCVCMRWSVCSVTLRSADLGFDLIRIPLLSSVKVGERIDCHSLIDKLRLFPLHEQQQQLPINNHCASADEGMFRYI